MPKSALTRSEPIPHGNGNVHFQLLVVRDMRAAHFCHACGKVQPPAPVDYFAFFGLPRKLNSMFRGWSGTFTN